MEATLSSTALEELAQVEPLECLGRALHEVFEGLIPIEQTAAVV
jgi:DNA-directed RNA polymerase subunit K/omega